MVSVTWASEGQNTHALLQTLRYVTLDLPSKPAGWIANLGKYPHSEFPYRETFDIIAWWLIPSQLPAHTPTSFAYIFHTLSAAHQFVRQHWSKLWVGTKSPIGICVPWRASSIWRCSTHMSPDGTTINQQSMNTASFRHQTIKYAFILFLIHRHYQCSKHYERRRIFFEETNTSSASIMVHVTRLLQFWTSCNIFTSVALNDP